MEKTHGRKESLLSLKAKVVIGKTVIQDGFDQYSKPAIVWSGGKDSSVVLHIARTVSEELGSKTPPVIFIDHGDHFPETFEFIKRVETDWKLRLLVGKNTDLLGRSRDGQVKVSELNDENRYELKKLGYRMDSIAASLDTVEGNHLLKTVVMNNILKRYRFDCLLTGVRWDENPARSGESFMSARHNPDHIRVHPVLHFLERDIWKYIQTFEIPFHPLYSQGYRSIDGVHDSTKTGNNPAWEQDLDLTDERGGRSKEKEDLMTKMRSMGYM